MKIVVLYLMLSIVLALANWYGLSGLKESMKELIRVADEKVDNDQRLNKLSIILNKVVYRVVLGLIILLVQIPLEVFVVVKKMKGS